VIATLLQALERDPNRVFHERDLERFPAAELEFAADKKLLRRVARGSSYRDDADRTLLLVENMDGSFEAIDEDDPEADPISLTSADLARWRIDLPSVAEEIRACNRFGGRSAVVDDRICFVGDALRDGRRVAVILGLFCDGRRAAEQLRALPDLLPGSYEAFVVACPSFVLNPHQQRRLEARDIYIAPVGADDLAIDLNAALARPRHRAPQVILSDDEEREVELHGFKSRLPIRITGKREPRSANVVEVAGEPVSVTDQPFKLFVRLVVALFEKPDGFVERGSMKTTSGLAAEGYYHPEGMEQAAARLRSQFRGALKRLSANAFIEARRGMIRLSTHFRFVSWDSEALLLHHDREIKRLITRLDNAAQTRTGSD
jgi:hypothetical protein